MRGIVAKILQVQATDLQTAKFADKTPALIGGPTLERTERYRELLSYAEHFNNLAEGDAEMTVSVVGTQIRVTMVPRGGNHPF